MLIYTIKRRLISMATKSLQLTPHLNLRRLPRDLYVRLSSMFGVTILYFFFLIKCENSSH